MENRKSKRSLRVALVLGTAVAGTALVGWGGLAAWNAYTENAGNSVAAGTLLHNNYVSSNCVSVIGVAPVGVGTGWCSAFMTITGADPVNNVLPATGVVKIDNTGTLQSTFSMSMPSAPTGSLCADLTLKVTSLSAGAPGTPYAATALSTTMGATSVDNDAGTPSATWSPNGTAGTGTGATGNTFTFTVAAGGNFPTDYADSGQSCTFSILFTQTAA
ncbi:MAG: hypothetical protein ABSH07_10915 [Candidatus Dormibacteria bacterium]|jgi:hypothetical protein